MKNFFKQLISFILLAGVLAGAYFVLDSKTDLFDKLFSREYEVTWVVDGKETTQKYVYGTIPEYEGTPEKEPTTEIEYVFDHWEPEVVAVSRTPAKYTAVFTPQTRLYSVIISSNYPNGATYTGTGKQYEYNTNPIVTISTNFGYNFLGWYDGLGDGATLVFPNTKTTLTVDDLDTMTADKTLYPKFSTVKYTAIYNDPKNVSNPNKTTLDATDGVYKLKALSKIGYTFNGFYRTKVGNVYSNKIEEIDLTQSNDVLTTASLNSNTITLYAKWTLTTYTISYNLNGGSVATPNPATYTVEDLLGDNTITINNPTKTDCEFLGWIGTGLNGRTTSVVLRNGDYGDRAYTACYDDERAITLVVEGKTLTDDVVIGHYGVSMASLPEIDYSNYGMGGYTVNKWYTDSACTHQQTFPLTPTEDLTLYGKWQYFIREGFLPYIDKFNARIHGSPLTIYSFDELVAWVEYVEFNYITTQYYFHLGYTPGGGRTNSQEVKRAIDESFYAVNGEFLYSGDTFYLKSSSKTNEGAQHIAVPAGKAYPQQSYAYKLTDANTRDEEGTLNIDSVSKTLNVETSNQLVYALEMGLKPVCKVGSMAETVYNAARDVLKEIISDDMSDITKLCAIYEWLIYNVEYDYEAAGSSVYNTSNWYLYDSWFAEGVFIYHKAVCDGFSKAFLILAQIENIPTIRISGDGHAWNRVYLDGAWYGIDATHGNLCVNGSMEVVNYAQFLFTDAFKTSRGYTGDNHAEYAATTVYCYYETADYSINYFGTHNFDLLIDSQSELEYAIRYAIAHKGSSGGVTYYSLDFAFSYVCNYETVIGNALTAAGYTGVNYLPINLGYNESTSTYGTDSDNHVAYCLLLRY